MMYRAGNSASANKDFQLWQHNYHPIELDSNYLIDQKTEYIHMKPVLLLNLKIIYTAVQEIMQDFQV